MAIGTPPTGAFAVSLYKHTEKQGALSIFHDSHTSLAGRPSTGSSLSRAISIQEEQKNPLTISELVAAIETLFRPLDPSDSNANWHANVTILGIGARFDLKEKGDTQIEQALCLKFWLWILRQQSLTPLMLEWVDKPRITCEYIRNERGGVVYCEILMRMHLR